MNGNKPHANMRHQVVPKEQGMQKRCGRKPQATLPATDSEKFRRSIRELFQNTNPKVKHRTASLAVGRNARWLEKLLGQKRNVALKDARRIFAWIAVTELFRLEDRKAAAQAAKDVDHKLAIPDFIVEQRLNEPVPFLIASYAVKGFAKALVRYADSRQSEISRTLIEGFFNRAMPGLPSKKYSEVCASALGRVVVLRDIGTEKYPPVKLRMTDSSDVPKAAVAFAVVQARAMEPLRRSKAPESLTL